MPTLYALHELDARLLNLERTLANLDNGERGKATLLAARRELERREEALRRARVALADAETSLKSNEVKQKQLNKQLYGGSVTSTRQAEATEHEIGMLKEAASDLETTILETMDAVEHGEAAVEEQKKVVAQREKELAQTLAAYAQESTRLRAQTAEAQKARAEAAVPVSAAMTAKYNAARKRTKDTGVAVLDGVTCSGCHMQVPGIAIKNLGHSEEIVTCDNCGRILYKKP
jgi:predicted  nucleic acid-binding Zn-ribbon protein